jgi:hypothetical protein
MNDMRPGQEISQTHPIANRRANDETELFVRVHGLVSRIRAADRPSTGGWTAGYRPEQLFPTVSLDQRGYYAPFVLKHLSSVFRADNLLLQPSRLWHDVRRRLDLLESSLLCQLLESHGSDLWLLLYDRVPMK